MTLSPADRPDWRRPDVAELDAKRTRSRTLVAGSDAVQAAGQAFLPKWQGEHPDDYSVRASLTEVFGAYPRTITASVGMAFATPPAIDLPEGETAPPELQAVLDDVDGHGTAWTVFARRRFEDALIDGVAGILVDYAAVEDPTTTTLETQRTQNLRPYWVPVLASQLINWRYETIANAPTLTLLVLAESVQEYAGLFGFACVAQWRVFRREPTGAITWEVWQQRDETSDAPPALVRSGTMTGVTRIPFAACVTGRQSGPLLAGPPLDDLAVLAVGHYRVAADRRYLMHVCHAPTFVIVGETSGAVHPVTGEPMPATFKLGPNNVLQLSTPNAKAEWVQADPTALDSSREEKQDQKQEMAALGMAFLARDKQGARETAEGRRLDGAAEHATLATSAQALGDCLDNALTLTGEFLGLPDAYATTVTTSYDEGTLDAQTILALNKMATDGNLPRREFLEALKAGRVLSAKADVEKVLSELEAQDAAASQQAMDLANAKPDPLPVAA